MSNVRILVATKWRLRFRVGLELFGHYRFRCSCSKRLDQAVRKHNHHIAHVLFIRELIEHCFGGRATILSKVTPHRVDGKVPLEVNNHVVSKVLNEFVQVFSPSPGLSYLSRLTCERRASAPGRGPLVSYSLWVYNLGIGKNLARVERCR